MWISFSYLGKDPIRISNPTTVNNETAAEMKDQYDYGQTYHTIHYLLNLFVISFQSITIMVNQVCKQEYNPYSTPIVCLLGAMLSIMILSYIRDGDVNFKMLVTMICGIFAVCMMQFIKQVLDEMLDILGIELFTTK